MSIFSLKRKPRHFNHVPIFYDERADRLQEIEARAKRAMEQDAVETSMPQKVHEAFMADMPHLQRRQRQACSWSANAVMLFLIIIVLLLVWYCLIK